MAILNIPITNVQPLNTLLTGISQLGYSGNAGLFLKVNATENGFEFSAAGSSGISIGDTIGSGTAGSVLFLGASNVLEQDNAYLNYNPTTKRLAIGLGSASGMAHIKTQTATDIGLIVQGTTSQTGNLTEWRDVGGTAVARITSNGRGVFNDIEVGVAGINISAVGGNGLNVSGGGFVIFKSSGVLMLSNSSVNDWDRLQFGGSTSSFPSLKRSGTELQVRLADDTGYADLAIGNLVSNTGSGIQLATAATQKIGIWGATPVTRAEAMATSISYSSIGGTSVRANDTWGGYTILTAIATLKGLGILP